jgi:hypothetical protein
VFLSTVYALWTARNKQQAWVWTLLTCILFTGASLNIIRTQLGLKWAFVDYRNFPGGPGAFFPLQGSLLPPSTRYGDASAVIVTWTSDAILVSGAVCLHTFSGRGSCRSGAATLYGAGNSQ